MQQQFLSDKTEDSLPPQVESDAAPEALIGIEAEADKLTAQNVTERLNKINKRLSDTRRGTRIGFVVTCICIAAGLSTVQFLLRSDNPYWRPLMYLVGASEFVALGLLFWNRYKTVASFDPAEIARIGGIQAIPPLFAALQNMNSPKRQAAIRDALITLAPQMKASDAHLLTPAAHTLIRAWLSTVYNPALSLGYSLSADACIAALKALEQIGDSNYISIVERLANMKTRTPAKARVKQAAIECLPMLRSHCGEVAAARTLLRAANAEEARPDTLLRAATGLPETASAELLRGANKP